jgi:Lon protease-like protein
MGDRHAAPAIPFRDEELVPWVKGHAEQNGTTAADVLRRAVSAYKQSVESPQRWEPSERQEITR